MPATIVSIDGVIYDPKSASISVFDRGLLYGDGCFEVLRTWGGVAVELPAHLDRLFATAAFLQLRSCESSRLAAWIHAAVGASGHGDHRIRVVLTRGPGALASPLGDLGDGRAIVIVEPLPPQPVEVSLAIVDWPVTRRPGHGHKTLAYLDHLMARELARGAGADEAVRLDDHGNVAEGATCNVFAIRHGVVFTPDVDGGVLPGIVRARVLATCHALGVSTCVGPLTVEALLRADEWFVTSSLRGVVPATRVDRHERPRGPITAKIATAYAAEMQRS